MNARYSSTSAQASTMLPQLRSKAFCALRLATLGALLASSASAHITLNSPTGGETLSVGQTFEVKWKITIQHALQNWDIHYSVSGPSGPWLPVALDLPAGSPAPGSSHTYNWLVPDNVSSAVRVRVTMDNAGTDYTGMSLSNLSIVACAAPSTYCTTSPNTAGSGATIGWTGTPNVSTNLFGLTASGVPANKPGLFFYGASQVSTPFGEGVRCVGGSLQRLAVQNADASGNVLQLLDVNAPPANAGPGQISAGSTYNFQLWYRDPSGGANGFNLSDGLNVTFCP